MLEQCLTNTAYDDICFRCKTCGHIADDLTAICKHVQQSHPECLVCGELIQDFGIIEDHYAQHELLECKDCKMIFGDYPTLRDHSILKHVYFILTIHHIESYVKSRQNLAYACKECGIITVLRSKGFTPKNHRDRCLVAGWQTQTLMCEVCDMRFDSEKVFKEHRPSHPVCHVCRRTLKDEEALLDHLVSHPICLVCGFTSRNQVHYTMHPISYKCSLFFVFNFFLILMD